MIKKITCIVLALAMTLSAAAFAFADSSDYQEAIDVMKAVKVFVGDGNGNFNGKDPLTREQAAKLVAYLMLGSDEAAKLVGKSVFEDVSSSKWSAPFIAFCAEQKIVAGAGDGKFYPENQVTGTQFGKMLLTCLGYDATLLTGSSWEINTAYLMEASGLLEGLDIAVSDGINREEAAQLCFNTLLSFTVGYTDGDPYAISNHNTIETIIDDDYMQLGEKLFPTLIVVATEKDHTWSFDGVKVGTYQDAESIPVETQPVEEKKEEKKEETETKDERKTISDLVHTVKFTNDTNKMVTLQVKNGDARIPYALVILPKLSQTVLLADGKDISYKALADDSWYEVSNIETNTEITLSDNEVIRAEKTVKKSLEDTYSTIKFTSENLATVLVKIGSSDVALPIIVLPRIGGTVIAKTGEEISYKLLTDEEWMTKTAEDDLEIAL